MRTVAITGVTGLLGSNLAIKLSDKGCNVLGFTSRPLNYTSTNFTLVKVDYQKEEAILALLKEHDVSVMVHCAAITNLNECEQNQEKAMWVNAGLSGLLASICKKLNIQFIHISTDCVYADSQEPVNESSDVNPLNVYAKTKLQAEQLIFPQHLILRTNLIGKGLRSENALLEWALSKLAKQESIGGFQDVYFSPLAAAYLADYIIIAMERKLVGLYNLGAADSISKYEFCRMLATVYGYDASLVCSASIDDFKSSVKRPKMICLDSQKIVAKLNLKLPSVKANIESLYQLEQTDYYDRIHRLFGFNKKEVCHAV